MALLPLIFAALEAGGATPGAATTATTRPDRVCAPVSELAEAQPPGQIFADFSDGTQNNATERWRVVADGEELKRLSEATYPSTQAFVWKNDGATLVRMFYTSESGDWARYEDHCFDRGGAIVRRIGRLNTFYGNVSRVRTVYFDSNGQEQLFETKLLDLSTQKPIQARDLEERDFMDQTDSIFMTLSALPFANLLQK